MTNEFEDFGEYTNWSERKTYLQERDLVKEAAESKAGERRLRVYLSPLVEIVIDQFVLMHTEHPRTREEMRHGAYTYLSFAVKKYKETEETKPRGFKFSIYFEWFMRQGMLDYPENNLEK